MKRRVSIFLSGLLVMLFLFGLPNTAQAATVDGGTCGENLTWILDDEGTLTIYGTGDVENGFFWYDSRIKAVVIQDGVTGIDDWAFYSCSSLTSVTIPNSMTSISIGAFQHCTSLISITLPNSVTNIDDGVFAGCSSLGSISIPDSVTTIGLGVFQDCTSLTSITLPNTVTSVGSSAFNGCSSLTSITIPDSVTNIGEAVFCDCTSLTGITIPNTVTCIGDSMFTGCSSLTSITIPNSVTSIGVVAFSGCSSLKSITIPDSVTSIGNWAFERCSSLAQIIFQGNAPVADYPIFDGVAGTAYYPASNATWTEAVMRNYGGTITWNPYCSDDHTFEAAVTEATCTAKGYTTYTCTVCGYAYEDNYVDAAGHKYSAVVTPPTATEQGFTTHTCSGCGDSYVDSYVDPIPQLPEAEIGFSRMILGNELAMQYAFKQADIDPDTDYVVSITKTYADGREDKVIQVPESQWKTAKVNGEPYYYVSFNGIAAKEMGDAIHVQVMTVDGVPAGEEFITSVSKYALDQLRKTNVAATRTLYVDMLNYGAAAQTYFGYNAENLINASLTAAEKGYATKSVKLENRLVKGIGYSASQLNLASSIQLRVRFSNIDSSMYAVIRFTNHMGRQIESRVEGSEFMYSGTVVVIDDVVAADFDRNVSVKVYDANGKEIANAVESVASYLARQTDKADAPAIYDAVAKYCASAYAYLHK